MLAGALTRNNAALVGASIGRKPTNGELYIAHFLGQIDQRGSQPATGECCGHVSARRRSQPQHFL
jgi:hypothetical protein